MLDSVEGCLYRKGYCYFAYSYAKIFIYALREAAGSESSQYVQLWNILPMKDLELPGDVWNNRESVRTGLFDKAFSLDDIPDSLQMPEVVRRAY